MIFNQYPYVNVNDLNLDYILNQIKVMMNDVTNFVSINAIKYANPIQWDITSQYEKNTIVIDPVTGTAYISVAPVPSGVALTRPEYWTVVFDLGSFVTKANQNIANNYEDETTTTATMNTTAGAWVIWGDVLYKALVNITAGDSYVVGSNIDRITIEDVYNEYLSTISSILANVGALVDLNTTDKTSIVAAINEVNSLATNTDVKIGDLADLITSNKDSIVDAINEVKQDANDLDDKIGNLANLTTDDKDTVVDAINEVDGHADTNAQGISEILDGTSPFSVLNAPNSLKFAEPTPHSRYFNFVPYTDPNGVTHNIMVAGSDADMIGSGMYINALLYGADPTGAEDSTSAIQDAIDYATSLSTGGVVYLPAGTYKVTDTLRLKARVSILGDGMRESILSFTNASTRVGIDAHSVDIRGQFIKGLALVRATKDNGPAGTYPDWTKFAGILCGSTFSEYNSAIFTIDNVFIQNFYTGISGTYYHGVSNAIGLFDSHLIDVWIDNMTACATILGGSGNKYDHLRITNCGSGFMFCRISDESFDGGLIDGCIVIGSTGYDITFRDAGYYRPITIIGTWFEQSGTGIVNMPYSTQLMTFSMIGNMFNSLSTVYELMTMNNCTKGIIEIFNNTFYSTDVGQNQNVVMPTTTTQCKGVIRDSVKIAPDGTVTIFDNT